jgi:hypothetical protein
MKETASRYAEGAEWGAKSIPFSSALIPKYSIHFGNTFMIDDFVVVTPIKYMVGFSAGIYTGITDSLLINVSKCMYVRIF